MALQVWLPLTGNLENKGLNGATVTNTNATVNASGKLGQCYLFSATSSSNSHLYLPTTIDTTIKTWSYCCWLKVISFPVGYVPLYTQRAVTNSTARSIFLKSTEILVDNGVRATISKTLPTLTNWNHFTFVCSATQIQVYVNGELFDTKTITNTAYSGISNDATIGSSKSGAGNTVNNGNNLNGYLNDVRIYDHCLSQQEVREISKGLILHYPLDYFKGVTGSNVNLAKGNYSCYTTSAGSTTSGSATFDTSIVTLNSLIGKTLTFSFYYSIEGAKQNTDTSDWHTYRYGIHLTMVGVQGGTTKTTYPCADYLTMSGTGRAVQHFTIPSDYTSISSLSFSIQPLNKPASGNSATWYIKQIKMELGNVATDWYPNSSDPEYNELGYNDTTIYDCSGFGNNGTASNLEMNTDSPRYNNAVYFNGTNACIAAGRGAMVTDEITYSIWHNTAIATVRAISCTEGGGWNIETNSNSYLQAPIYASGAYRIAATTLKTSDLGLNTWHMLTVTWNGLQTKFYIDGELASQSTALSAKTPITYNANNGLFIGAEAGANQTTPASYCQQKISDVRVYATALSADDVKHLYNRGASIDNAGNLHCGELVEDETATKQQVKKNTQVKCRNFSELTLKYDDTIYVEPDGSMWVRIVRQNNPTSNKFASTDSFTTSVYKSVNTWFYAAFCNYVDKWELMVKQLIRNATSETKYRWVQQYNPMTATYANVARANITYNTSSGYATPTSTYGGLYNHNSNTKLCANNNASGNWFGAIGAWAAHDGGIPGWNNTVVTTGYEDLYLRIDNVTFVNLPANTKTQFLKSGDINSTEIYEQ